MIFSQYPWGTENKRKKQNIKVLRKKTTTSQKLWIYSLMTCTLFYSNLFDLEVCVFPPKHKKSKNNWKTLALKKNTKKNEKTRISISKFKLFQNHWEIIFNHGKWNLCRFSLSTSKISSKNILRIYFFSQPTYVSILGRNIGKKWSYIGL